MNNEHIIPAVEKAVLLLERLGQEDGGATQAELARELGITASTCYRIIQTLQKYDWLCKLPGNRYDLSGGIMTAARRLADRAARFEVLQPLLRELSKQSGLSCKLSIRQGVEQVTILREESPRELSVSGKVGARFPLIEGSVGAALLSGETDENIMVLANSCRDEIKEKEHPELIMERIRDIRGKGYCFNARLNRWKVDAMSVPLADANGQATAALTLLGFDEDFVDGKLGILSKILRQYASECTAVLTSPLMTETHDK